MAKYKTKQHVILKFIHEEKHIVFNDIGKNRRKKEVYGEIEIVIAMMA